MVEAGRHRNIELLTYSELSGLDGSPGRFRAKVTRHARSVDMEKCTGCGICSKECLVHNRIERREAAPLEPDEEIEAIVDRYNRDAGMLIPMMQDIQEQFGFLPRDRLAQLSRALKVPLPRIYGAATYYASFRLQPRGEHTITLCMGTVCYLRGADQISEAIQREFHVKPNGTSDDGKFTLLQVNCLGACALAPVMVVDGEYHGGLSAGSAVDVLGRTAAGEKVAGAEQPA
jgi:NADH-quinone oxidoreductase subunit E